MNASDMNVAATVRETGIRRRGEARFDTGHAYEVTGRSLLLFRLD